MSEFFRALERAERERALRTKTAADHPRPARMPEASGAAPEAAFSGREAVAGRVAAAVDEIPIAAVPDTVEIPVVDMMPVTTPPDERAADAPPTNAAADAGPAERSSWTSPLSSFLGRGDRPADTLDEHLVSLITPGTFEADQYRVLRHTVEQRRRTAGLGVIAVSSAGAGDGKTTTAINLAGALAQDRSARVLLADCDLRGSAMARRLGLAEGRGLVQAIVDPTLALDDAIRHLPRFNLDVMAAGFETSSPYELLRSPRLTELFDAARRRYDYIVVDTPPVVPFPDCRILGKVVDGFLLIVQAHRTPRRLVDEALGILPKELLVGVVFNGHDPVASPAYDAYYDRLGEPGAEGKGGWGATARRAFSRAWRDDRATATGGR